MLLSDGVAGKMPDQVSISLEKYIEAVHYEIKIEDIVIIRSDKGSGQKTRTPGSMMQCKTVGLQDILSIC